MKKILHVIPTLKYGGISSVICSWHNACHGNYYHFDYISFNDGPLKDKLLNDGSSVAIIPTMREAPLAYFSALFRVIKDGNYDGVHVHNSFKNGAALWLSSLMGVKLRVCHSHTAGLEDGRLRKYLPFLKWLVNRAATTKLACGKEAGEFLYGREDFTVVNNTINLERIYDVRLSRSAILKNYGIPDGKRIIGHIGRFSSVKNHSFILKLASKLDDTHHFVLVGSGPLEEQIREEITAGLSDRFTLIKPTTEIPELLSIFDVFILPSLFEGVSLALLEAQAASLKCLVSDNVPRENDIGLGLVEFLSIDDVSSWVARVTDAQSPTLANDEITEKFDLIGYSDASLARNIRKIYG